MEATTAQLAPLSRPLFDEARLAVGGFLARYSGNTRAGYACDLRAWLAWCAQVGLEVFAVRRPDVELYAGWMEEDRHLARATIGRRLPTVVGFYRYAVIDGYLAESPAEHVRRPKSTPSPPPSASIAWSSAPFWPRQPPPGRSTTRWPVCLRSSDRGSRRRAGWTSNTYGDGRGQGLEGGRHPASPPSRPCHRHRRGRTPARTVLLSRSRQRLDRHGATRIVRRPSRRAGIVKHISPHSLRHSFMTAAVDVGVPLGDLQIAARRADPRTTTRNNLDRHASYVVTAFVAGAS